MSVTARSVHVPGRSGVADGVHAQQRAVVASRPRLCAAGADAAAPFLILDEPTNHLDIDSIEAVEAGLLAYDGALFAVSHDEAFLKAIGITSPIGTAPTVSFGST